MKIVFCSLVVAVGSVFGGEVVIDKPKEMSAEWEQKVFGVKYGVTTLDNAVAEMVEGLIDDTFDKAFIQRIHSAIAKNTSGIYEEYWENGTLKARLPYKEGKAHGHLHGWYDNGRDAFKGHFKDGVKQGIHITFFRTEPRQIMKDARMITFNEKGQLDGKLYKSHQNGNLWAAILYDNGIANGPLEGWDSNGKCFLSAQYENGVLQKDPPPEPIDRKRPKDRADFQYVDEVTQTFKKIAQKEFGLIPSGSGGGMPFDVERIGLDFNAQKKLTIDGARELLVKVKEKFLEVINAHEKLRPYLREYPFTPIRAEIFISFYDKKGSLHKDGNVRTVLVDRDNRICYYTADLNNPKKENFTKEPYDEAVKIVHKGK